MSKFSYPGCYRLLYPYGALHVGVVVVINTKNNGVGTSKALVYVYNNYVSSMQLVKSLG